MYEKLGFKVVDSHIHILGDIEQIDYVLWQKKKYGYEKVNILGADAMGDLTQTAKSMAFKLSSPGDFAFAGLRHTGDKSFLDQAKDAWDMGFDGFKMIEGKPGTRKNTALALNDEKYDPFYSFLEDNKIPLVLHAADPASMWDENSVSDYAKEQGWFYGDGTYQTKEEITNEVIGILKKHNKLKIILAHFFFMSSDLDRAGELFDTYQNLYFDITPGVEMFADFANDIAKTKRFFEKYQKRIIFGTDNYDVESQKDENDKEVINGILHRFLCTSDKFNIWGMDLEGINLNDVALKNILRDNFLSLVGNTPRKVDVVKYINYCENLSNNPVITLEANKKTFKKAIEIAKKSG